ncbi:MAG: hypothetical protein ACM3PF_13745 [Bacteroidota bacterium]
MRSRRTRHTIDARRGAGRPRFSRAAALAAACALASLALGAGRAEAGSGGGSAYFLQPDSTVAGSKGQWTVYYRAGESFGNPQGGSIEIRIPDRWTPPQNVNPGAPGYVDYTNTTVVSSLSIAGQVIHLGLSKKFLAGDIVSVLYGVGGPSSLAAADTLAGVDPFLVSSDPQGTGTLDTLATGSPRVWVLPDTVGAVRITDGAGVEVGSLGRNTDQDTTHFFLRGYDRYGNFSRFVNGAWRVSGGIGYLTDSTASSRRLVLTTAGTGKAYADSGAWHDSTSAIVVFHGAYAALAAPMPALVTAGVAFAASAEARDADGNRITDGSGSAAPIRFVAYADSLGSAPADPSFTNALATLAAGFWSGALTAQRSGTFYVAARDTSTGLESAPRGRLVVSPAAPVRIELRPDTLRLVAGVPDTVTILARDAFGNRAPFAAGEELTLWTDRPQGRFEDFSGSPIFSVTIPAGRDSADVRFRDTQSTAAAGHARAIDANGTGPYVGTAEAAVFTAPAAPSGALALAATPDTLVANGADSAFVRSGVVRDAYGNPVAAGERFTVGTTGLAVITDVDPVAPGAQWAVGADSTVAGWVRAGTAAGSATVSVASQRGSASGSAALATVPGPPAGAIALAAAPDSLAADGIATRTVTAAGLRDAFGNAVPDGEAFTVAATLGTIAAADADPATPGIQVRATGGAIAFDLLGGTTLGTAAVSAASVRGTASGTVDVRLVPGAVSADSSGVSALSPVAVGAPGSRVTITLRDRVGHPLAGVPSDSIAVASSGVALAALPLATTTDASGAIGYSAAATSAATAVVSVVARGVPLAAHPSILFTHGPLDTLVVTGPAGPLAAGTPDSIAVEARDAFGNVTADRSDVVHATVTAGAAGGLPTTLALSGGRAAIPFLPTLAQPLAISVADDSSHATGFGPVAVRPGPPYRIAADPPASDTLQAGGSEAIRARVFDAFGNPAAGDSVAASIVAGGGGVTPGASVTDASGAAAFTLSAGAAPGLVTVRLVALGSGAPDAVRSDSVSVFVVPSGAAAVAIATAPSVRAGDALDVSITLRDAFGNVAISATPALQLDTSSSLPDSVSWSLGPGAVGALADDPASDRATYVFAAADSGTAVLRVRFVRAETVLLTAAGVGPGAQSGDVAVTPAVAATLAVTGGQGQTAVVHQMLAQPLQITARDAFGNLVPGAVVSFRSRGGVDSLDVARGAPADSDAVTDASGAARCEVVRLGTVAGSGANRVVAALPAPGDSVLFVASALPDTAAALSIAPASLALLAGGSAPVTATARDRFANPVPGTPLTFYLGTAPAGSLASSGSTSGTGTTQAGATDAAGQLAVLYRAPARAPAADSIFVRGYSVGPAGLAVSVSPSGIASLFVAPDLATWTAGDSARVVVHALDASGNAALGDTATIVMGATVAGVAFRPASGPLSGADFVTYATAAAAGSLQVTARTASGGAPFSSGPVAVVPAAPSGAIPIAAGRDTLTADGRSTTALVFGPLHDAFGNAVAPGALLTVGADSLLAADASPAAGLQIATGADGLARAVLVAPATPGSGFVRAASVAGTARDSLVVVYLAPPSLAWTGAFAPAVVAPGQAVSFTVDVSNAAATGSVTLGTGSALSFGSGAGAFTSSPVAPVTIPAGSVRTLAFAPSTIPPALQPGTYAPALRLTGTDATGAPIDFYLALSGAQVYVAGIRVTAVSAVPDPAPLGSTVALTFRVDNLAATPASITNAALTPASLAVAGIAPALPAPLGPLGSATLTISAQVPASGIPAGSDVSADLTASASFGGVAVGASTQSSLRFQVVSAAVLASQAAGTAPSRYLRGRTFGPTARVANSGSAPVTLDAGVTKLVLANGSSRLVTALTAAAALPGAGAADLAFDSLTVPSAIPLGRYAATLVLAGSESGQAFADTIPLAPDSLDVVDPAILSVAGPLDPGRVSAGQTRPVQLTLVNAGDVPYALDASTRLTLGPPVSSNLALAAAGSVPAHASLAVSFTAAPLGSPLAPPGAAAAVLEAHGTEDGRARDQALDAGALAVEAPARIVYVGGSTTPDTVRAGATLPLAATVRNDGGSPFMVDPAAATLLVSDGVESAVATASGAPFALAPGASAPLAFASVAFPAAFASQAYPVALTVRGTEWGLAESLAVVSPAGELRVIEPAPALQVRALDPGAPIQAAPDGAAVPLWRLELRPLVPPGGSSSAHLLAVSFTVLVDGAVASDPAATLAAITLRDSLGAVLAQAAPAASGKTTLVLAAPLALTGPPATVDVQIAIRGGAAARSVALRLADAADVDARDDLTQSAVPVSAAGGLPFTPLTSPSVTLFTKPHGYPNPFRAGRESVHLSYRLAADAPVRIAIYTLLGDLVRTVSLAAGAPGGARGLNEVPWDGRNGNGDTVRPGVYVASIEGGGLSERIKVGVLR